MFTHTFIHSETVSDYLSKRYIENILKMDIYMHLFTKGVLRNYGVEKMLKIAHTYEVTRMIHVHIPKSFLVYSLT